MMSKSKTVEIDGIGPVLFERSLKAKNVRILIKPFKGVCVVVPKGTTFHEAGQFVHIKRDWIKKKQAIMGQMEKQKAAMSKQLNSLDWGEAEEQLIKRTIELAKKHGFSHNKVTIRNQKTKWGSCSFKNNISLNIQLSLLPQEMIDYVILHELVHTRVKNHSKEFWSELDKYVGDAKLIDAKMKQYAVASQ